jgi:transposase
MRFVLLKSAGSLDLQSLHRVRDRLIGERRRAPGHTNRARVTALVGRRKFEPALAALLDGGGGQSGQLETRLAGLIQI